jgi:hypothetical protein
MSPLLAHGLASALCIGMILGNIALYRHYGRKLAPAKADPRPYPKSLPTRLFRYVKGPLYLSVPVHIAWEISQGQIPDTGDLLGGLLVAALALVLQQQSLKTLGANYSPCDAGQIPQQRITYGPYRLRHPIYISNLLQFLAVGWLYNGPILWAAVVTLIFFYVFSIRDEERVWQHHPLPGR